MSYLFDAAAPLPPSDTGHPTDPLAQRPRLTPTRRGRRVAAGIALIMVLAIVYGALCAFLPLPQLAPAAVADVDAPVVASTETVDLAVAEEPLPTAITWLESTHVAANTTETWPIASLTKLIALLVAGEHRQLAPGSDGDTYTWTFEDQLITEDVFALDGVAYDYPVGFELTSRDMFALMLVASSNNTIISYINWVFGDTDEFVAATKDWAGRHGFTSLDISEPTGLDPLNRATPADLAAIARLALNDPTIAEFVSMRRAEVPVHGVIENTNPILDTPGVIGIKTGTTLIAGYNLIAAQRQEIGGRSVTAISVALGRDTPEYRIDSSLHLLDVAAQSATPLNVAEAGQTVGSVTTWTGESVALILDQGSETVTLPGETVQRSLALTPLSVGPGGEPAGTLTAETPTGQQTLPVVTAAPIEEPGIWWRLTHPLDLFLR